MAYQAPIEVVPYSPEWHSLFVAECAVLASVFPAETFRIEHVGSTAVPGLGAKPIVDILVGGRSLADFEAKIPAIEALGYQYIPEHEAAIPQRRFFAKPVIRPRKFHVHAVEKDSLFFVEQLLFRDALRTNSRLADEYLALKVALAERFRNDREGYTDAKSAFIQSVIEHARNLPSRASAVG